MSSLDFLSRRKSADVPVRRLPAWLIPVGIFAGFGLFFVGLYRDRILPAPTVEVAPVLATSHPSSSAGASGMTPVADSVGAVLFQASGWIEPEPFPIRVPVLIDGVIADVQVLEGQTVKKGELLATLVDDDAKLAAAAAEARLKMLKSVHQAQIAALEAARKKSEASEAEATATQTLAAEADQQLERFNRVAKSGGVSELDVISARLRLRREKSLHQAAQAKNAELLAEVRRMESELQAKHDEISLAEVAQQQAHLALRRTRISSPVNGRVLRLMAGPGDKKMLSMDHPESSTVCILYEPQKLQARVDVPLANVAQLQTSQKVRVHTGIFSDKVLEGEVTRITGEADVQRNTLQVKVRIHHPPDQLRPEMLCRVEFLGGSGGSIASVGAQGNSPLALWIPESAYRDGGVWVYDPDRKRLVWRVVETNEQKRENYLNVSAGLRPGEQVVTTSGNWREGQRVHVRFQQP